MIPAVRVAAMAMLVASCCAAADGQADWPQWRGPARNGVDVNSPKLLEAWGEKGPKLLWTHDGIPSGREGGCGSVTVADGKVIAYVRSPEDKKHMAAVMYKAGGEKFEQLGMIPADAGPNSSPSIAAGRLYVRLTDGIAYYDLKAE